jgi:hypothetical protein
MYIVGKYKIYLYKLLFRNRKKSKPLVSMQLPINFIFPNNVYILCLYCNVMYSQNKHFTFWLNFHLDVYCEFPV